MITKIAACVAAFTALSLPATASANPLNDYLEDVSDIAGLSVTKTNESEFLVVGMGICVDLLSGISESQERNDIMELGMTALQAQQLIQAAVVDLCPQAAGTVGVA